MRKIVFQGDSNKIKITIAKDEIRIKHHKETSKLDLLRIIRIARKLEEEHQDITYTMRVKIEFNRPSFRVTYGGRYRNVNKIVKQLSDYL